MLAETPIALPVIYILAGLEPDEACVIERLPDRANMVNGTVCAANAWQAPGWFGRSRGKDNPGRLALMRTADHSVGGEFEWLRPPILNRRTRLVFIADASRGSVVVQGYEAERPAPRFCRRGSRKAMAGTAGSSPLIVAVGLIFEAGRERAGSVSKSAHSTIEDLPLEC